MRNNWSDTESKLVPLHTFSITRGKNNYHSETKCSPRLDEYKLAVYACAFIRFLRFQAETMDLEVKPFNSRIAMSLFIVKFRNIFFFLCCTVNLNTKKKGGGAVIPRVGIGNWRRIPRYSKSKTQCSKKQFFSELVFQEFNYCPFLVYF